MREIYLLETSYLLLFGRLPTTAELLKWTEDITHHRRIKFRIVDLLKCLPERPSNHPMDALQAAVAALGMFWHPGRNVGTLENNYWSAVRLIAKLPTIVAAWARLRHGDEYIRRATTELPATTFCTCSRKRHRIRSGPRFSTIASFFIRAYDERIDVCRYGHGLDARGSPWSLQSGP
ncbi:MAG: citrate/2-methylcitrate synthase [Nitrospiraceae bacterium]